MGVEVCLQWTAVVANLAREQCDRQDGDSVSIRNTYNLD